MVGFGVRDSIRKLVDDHSFCSRLNSAPMQRSGLHLSASQRVIHSPYYLSSYLQNNRFLIRSKLTVTNKGTYQDTLACMQLYHTSRARPKFSAS